jgi:TonB-linked SusC/RagA family outer membrane protein
MIMNKLVRLVLAALAIAVLPDRLAAQGDGTISGRVIDQTTQNPVADAQVVLAGTQRGAQTDQQGRFTITGVPAGTYELRVRRVGYAPTVQRVTVGEGVSATADFALATSAARLEEVVVNAVTGQVQRRVEVGTNTGFINVGDLNKGPITQMSDVLQGRVAGVNLQNAAGTAGASQKIRIRGANSLSLSNEPLLYLDGIRISNGKGGISLGGQDYSRLNDINPEEIENVEILKGPAASAIYGSAAAVGVILITTKKGRAGEPRWSAYAETGRMKDKTDYPLNYAALTSFGTGTGTDYYDIPSGGILNIRSLFGATAPYDICPNYRAALATGTTGACTQDVVLSFDQFRDPRTTPFQTGARAKLGLNVSGGSEALTYYLSGDQEQENGVLRPNNLSRLSLRANLNANIGHNATAAITAAYVASNTERIGNDNNIFSPLINALLGTAQYLPGMESDTAGSAGARLGSFFGYNTFDQRKVKARQSIDRFVIGANSNYTPISWLKFNGNAGLDYYGRFDPQTVNPNELPLALSYIVGFRDATRARNYQWTANGSATASFTPLSSLVSNTTFGGSFQRALFETLNCFGIGIPAGTASCAATTSQFAVNETYTDEKTLGIFGRQELAFADKLFLSGSLRGDNNSGLLTDQEGLAWYPSFNGSWLISREGFMQRLGFLSQLRLRTGWGQAGLRPGFGDADTFFGARAVQQAGAEVPALILTRTGNAALKIERTTEFEGGFDAGFFDDRISTEFTAFRRRSEDALISRNLAPSAGLSGSVFQNLGRIKNWGTEFGLNANVLDVSNFRLDARLTTTTLHNRIEELGAGIAPITLNRGTQAHREGFPTGAYFARPLKWNDADGNGLLSRAEVTVDTSRFLIVPSLTAGKLLDTVATAYLGPVLPTSTRGISFDVTLFRNISISTLFEHRGGNKQLNYTEYFRCQTANANPFYSQCAGLANPKASLEAQAAAIGATTAALGSTAYGYVEDASFTKWRELSVRFGLPESMARSIRGIRGATVSLSGRNLKTWTKYTGLDPEINESGGGANFTQGEFNTQPPVRTFTLRFDLKL